MTKEESDELRELARGQVVLEIGSWLGYSTTLMAQVAMQVHSVDWHMGDSFTGYGYNLYEFLKNIDNYKHNIICYIGTTKQILPIIGDKKFDLIFIDGDHSYDAVCHDLSHAERQIKHGGKIACHDYGVHTGVTRAVDLYGGTNKQVGSLIVLNR